MFKSKKHLIIVSCLVSLGLSHAHAAKVLMIGDSQSAGIYGKELDRLLRADGHVVETQAVPGSIANWWFTGQDLCCGYFGRDYNGNTIVSNGSTPLIKPLLEKDKPEYVIMEFGGNYRGYADKYVEDDIKTLIDAVKNSGAKCMFVTGPNSNYKRELYLKAIAAVTKAVGDRCEFFDSTKVTKPPANGELHYNSSNPEDYKNAQDWAVLVEKSFNRFLNTGPVNPKDINFYDSKKPAPKPEPKAKPTH